MRFRVVSNFVPQQYFAIFQQLDWEFDQDTDLKGELHSNYVFLYLALIGLEWELAL